MRIITLILIFLLLLLQYPLWLGHGGWLRVWDLPRPPFPPLPSNNAANPVPGRIQL
jgi:cell division protein FtsB